MQYLIEKYNGGYYVSNKEPKINKKNIDESDSILVSFPKGQMISALKLHFSKIKTPKGSIEYYYEIGLSLTEVVNMSLNLYEEDKEIILYLLENKIITLSEAKILNKSIYKTQKEQIGIILKYYNKTKLKILKKNNGDING